MPSTTEEDVYIVSRSYTQKAEVQVGDKVKIRAESEEETRQKAKENKIYDALNYKTGHMEFGEIVSGVEVQLITKTDKQ
jgi:hypothetical protein